MFPIQTPFLFGYFKFGKSNKNSHRVNSLYMLSWEDSLWHLLTIYRLQQGIILVPEFFCGDVVKHMQEHGLKVKYYKVDRKLKTSLREFLKAISKNKPNIIVIFHSIGITNTLFCQSKRWIIKLPKSTVIIEDCVHRIIEPYKINFLSERHFVIDSLRKVLPLQGSFIYSKNNIPEVKNHLSVKTMIYSMCVYSYWILLQIYLLLVYFVKSQKLKNFFNLQAERALIKGYLVVGSNLLPARGSKMFETLHSYLNIRKIKKIKRIQFKIYKKYLNISNNNVRQLNISKSDFQELSGYPLVLNLNIANNFLGYCRKNGLILWFGLDDSIWSEYQKVVYLPMGPHVNSDQIKKVISIINSYR